MSTSDIIKAREGLANNCRTEMSSDSVDALFEAREALAAFERLIAEPVTQPPQMTMRTYMAISAMQGIMANPELHDCPDEKMANYSVNAADALIDRLSRK